MSANSSPEDVFGAAATHGLSWLDLARGRLRLDRLSRNGAGSTFFPWAYTPRAGPAGTPVRPFLARQESRPPPGGGLVSAILRCAPARERVRRRSPPAS
jgi:hypothetical protein